MANNNYNARKLNIFNVPTQFETKMGNTKVLVKGAKLDETTHQYMLYIPKATENDYHVAVATWDKTKYELPTVRIFAVHTDPVKSKQEKTSIKYVENDKKAGIVKAIQDYTTWRESQVNSTDVFENLCFDSEEAVEGFSDDMHEFEDLGI